MTPRASWDHGPKPKELFRGLAPKVFGSSPTHARAPPTRRELVLMLFLPEQACVHAGGLGRSPPVQ